MLALLESQRSRAIRKLDIGSRTREESERVHVLRSAQKEVTKADQLFQRYFEEKEIVASCKSRRHRWATKLSTSPLKENLVEEDIRRTKVHALTSQRRKRSESAQSDINKRVTSLVMEDSINNSPLEMRELRRAKRELLFQAKYLRAMKDVEKSTLLYTFSFLIRYSNIPPLNLFPVNCNTC